MVAQLKVCAIQKLWIWPFRTFWNLIKMQLLLHLIHQFTVPSIAWNVKSPPLSKELSEVVLPLTDQIWIWTKTKLWTRSWKEQKLTSSAKLWSEWVCIIFSSGKIYYARKFKAPQGGIIEKISAMVWKHFRSILF
jgi:hypothetical protein